MVWAPGVLPTCLALGGPASTSWRALGVSCTLEGGVWPSEAVQRAAASLCSKRDIGERAARPVPGAQRPGKPLVALCGAPLWLVCPGSPPVLEKMTATHTTHKHQKISGSLFFVGIGNIGGEKKTTKNPTPRKNPQNETNPNIQDISSSKIFCGLRQCVVFLTPTRGCINIFCSCFC